MPTMLNDDGVTGNAKVDAELKKAKGNGQKAAGKAGNGVSNAAESAKKMAAEADERTRGFIGHWPYAAVISTFALGLFFGAMAGGK